MPDKGNLIKKVVMISAIAVASVGLSANAADWDSKGGMSHDDMHGSGHGDAKHGKSKSWDGGGMQAEGHMTARMRAVWSLDLEQAQKDKIRKITRALRAEAWAIDDKIEDVSDELFGLYQADKRDAKKIGDVYGKIFDLRRQKIEKMVEGGNQVEAVLTKKQLEMLKKWRPKHKWGGGWGK